MGCKCGCQYIVNKKYELCEDCNYKRLHNGLSRLDIAKSKSKDKPKKPIKRYYKTAKAIEREDLRHEKDRQTYFEVFSEKPHECEECGTPLPDEFTDDRGYVIYVDQYSHILGKQSHPEFRNDKRNFNRLCGIHHDRWEYKDKENMKIYKKNQEIIQILYDERSSKTSR